MVVLIVCTTLLVSSTFVISQPYQTTPWPSAGARIQENPPCFVYPSRRSMKGYLVEYSTNRLFPPQKTVQLESPYMLACPQQPVRPGSYFWRWRPLDEGRWSLVRAFTVSKDTAITVSPDIKILVDRIRGVHPRLYVPSSGLAELRDQAKRTFGGTRWLKNVHMYAQRMSKKKLLSEPAFLPPRGNPRRQALYQKTFRTTRPFFREMARLAEDYLLTGDELSGREAKRRLLHIVAWDPLGSTGINQNDEPATEIVRYCSTVYDRVYSLLSAKEKQQCLKCLTIRMKAIMERWRKRPFEKYPYESHNMGYFLPDMLVASLALAGDAPVEEMLRYTMLQFWSPFYPPFGGDDGGWSEGPGYWCWSTAVVARMYKLVESVARIPLHERSTFMRNTARFKLYANPPYFKMSPFGDGQAGGARGGTTMLMLAALYRDPYAKWYAEWQHAKLQGMNALLFDASKVHAKSPYDLPQGHAFYGVGLVAMHTVLPDPDSNVAMLFRSSPFGSISHSYADQNTFYLDVYGEPMIIASGYYQLYGSPHHSQWTWTTQASNSVLVNGKGQSRRDWNAKGRIALFQNTPAGDYAVGDAAAAYKGRLKQFDRRIVFLRPALTGGEAIVVIRDDLAATRPSTFQFLLHALNKMYVTTDKQRVTFQNHQSRCRVEFLAPTELTFTQTDQFSAKPVHKAPNQWHLTVSTTEPKVKTHSLIVIQPYRRGHQEELLVAEPVKGQGCVGVRLNDGIRTVTVLYRTDFNAQSVSLGDIVTDGQAASVCTIAGRVRSAVQFGGSHLMYAGRMLVRNGTVWFDTVNTADSQSLPRPGNNR